VYGFMVYGCIGCKGVGAWALGCMSVWVYGCIGCECVGVGVWVYRRMGACTHPHIYTQIHTHAHNTHK